MDFNLESELFNIKYNLLRMSISLLLSLPVAWNREITTRYVGLRTFPLVAIGTCAFILNGFTVVENYPNAKSRIVYGVITGMGFTGGGAIIKANKKVVGTANAASLWCTGAMGTAVALNQFEIAIVLTLIVFSIFVLKNIIK